jgi:hypothetical protein
MNVSGMIWIFDWLMVQMMSIACIYYSFAKQKGTEGVLDKLILIVDL